MQRARWGRALAALVVVGLVWGCGGSDDGGDVDDPGPGTRPTLPDGGTVDAGPRPPDAGPGMPDGGSGMPDGGTGMPDGGTGMPDGGMGMPDGGMGMPDGGTPPPTGGTTGWKQQYGSTGREDRVATAGASDGSFVVLADAVRTTSFGGVTFPDGGDVVARYDAAGRHLWSTQLTGLSGASDVALADDGTVYVAGLYSGAPVVGGRPLPQAPTERGLFLLELSASGTILDVRGSVVQPSARHAEPHLSPPRLHADPLRHLVLSGGFQGALDLGCGVLDDFAQERTASPMYVARLEGLGRCVWSRSLRAAVYAPAVTADGEGNVFLAGEAWEQADIGDGSWGNAAPAPFVASLAAATGATRWHHVLTGAQGRIDSVARAPAGHVVLAATVRHVGLSLGGTQLPATGERSAVQLASVRTDGTFAWARQYRGPGGDAQVVVDTAGRLTLSVWVGTSTNLGGQDLVYRTGDCGECDAALGVGHYDASGAHLWSRLLPNFTTYQEPLHDLVAQPDGSAVLVTTLGDGQPPFEGQPMPTAGEYDLLFLQLRP